MLKLLCILALVVVFVGLSPARTAGFLLAVNGGRDVKKWVVAYLPESNIVFMMVTRVNCLRDLVA